MITVAQMIGMLQSLPAEAQNNALMVQADAPGHTFTAPLAQVYCVQQNQYTSKIDGMIINQEMYDKLKDEASNDFFLVKQDFDLMCPAHTVFVYSKIEADPETQVTIEPQTQPEPTKADLVKSAIVEGSIPHLKHETD